MIKIKNVKLDIKKEVGYYVYDYYKFKTIEEVVMHYFQTKNYSAIYTENKFWRALLYIFYNNIIIDIIEDTTILKFDFQKETDIRKLFRKKYSYYNSGNIFSRKHFELLLKSISVENVIKILFYLKVEQTGFPDIMIYNDKELKFYEVKNKNDSLRNSQAKTLNLLSKNNVNVELFTINFTEAKIQKTNDKLKVGKEKAREFSQYTEDIIRVNFRKRYWYEKWWGIILMFIFWYIAIPMAIISYIANKYFENLVIKTETNRILEKKKK